MVAVTGEVAAGFEQVRDVFVAGVERDREAGAAVAVYHRGRRVVDLWGGVADRRTGRPWSPDTLQVVYSVTKAVVAVCAHLLVQRGELALDVPVREYWPEFAAAGKRDVPVRWLLSHQSGVVTLNEPLPLGDALDWYPMVRALAVQRPAWRPGTAHGTHTRTYGWLVGEIIRRVSGRTPGVFLAEEIARPQNLDLHVGLPAPEQPRLSFTTEDRLDAQFAGRPPATVPAELRALAAALADQESLTHRARQVTFPDLDFNDPVVLASEVPASNGVCTARSLARFFGSLVSDVDGIRLLEPATVAAAVRQQAGGLDRVMLRPVRLGSGFMLYPTARAGSQTTFGYTGRGGSMGYASLESQIGFGYVTNHLIHGSGGTSRATDLAKAVRACVGG